MGLFVTVSAATITLPGADISGFHAHFVTYTLSFGTRPKHLTFMHFQLRKNEDGDMERDTEKHSQMSRRYILHVTVIS